MAAFSVIGFIDAVKILPDSCIIFLSEYKKGYRKADGTIVDDKYVSWKVIYKGYFIKYITSHFGKGMLVEVKGEVLPYAIEHGEMVAGVSVIGQTCNIYSSYSHSNACLLRLKLNLQSLLQPFQYRCYKRFRCGNERP